MSTSPVITQTHACAAEGCERQIARTYLMCRDHWRLLKPETADGLYFAWSAYKRALNPQLSRRALGRFNHLMDAAQEQIASAGKPQP